VVFFWALVNIGYVIVLDMWTAGEKQTRFCNDMDFLLGFSIVIAFQSGFKIACGFAYLMQMKQKVKFDQDYTIKKRDLTVEFKKIRERADSDIEKTMVKVEDLLQDDGDYQDLKNDEKLGRFTSESMKIRKAMLAKMNQERVRAE